MAWLERPWHLFLVLAALVLALAWLAPRVGLHGGQPWAHVGRALLLLVLAAGLLAWADRHSESSPRWVAVAYIVAAGLSLLLGTDVSLFHTSIPSWLALAAPLGALAWELVVVPGRLWPW